jgi:hypothetical protein
MLLSRLFRKRPQSKPSITGMVPCPYDGVAYRKVPGYVPGYGCPVCKGIGPSHVMMDASYVPFTPACHDCQKYRVLIQKAMDNCNTAFADTLREDFKRHIAKEHNHARHS